jgi:hypothetical protein
MQRLTDALDTLRNRIVDLASRFIAHLPEVLAALLITLAGWLIGRWLRRLTMSLGERIYRRLDRSGRTPDQEIVRRSPIVLRLPVVAGQSGNAGAQALAVTMRGLVLREISPRQWLVVSTKEASVGLLNGVAVAITCGLGVYLWSRSIGWSWSLRCR